jgi:hypothetical protein
MDWKPPVYGNDLSQFLYALTWIKTTILNVQKHITFLREEVLEILYTQCKRRTERELKKRVIGDLWTKEAQSAYEEIKKCVKNSIALKYMILTKSCAYLQIAASVSGRF